ncbi:hypothetical protein CHS0354_024563 [Potamilus streckersoni]|uniref:OTU domain-containing protein n=1 Tax=Potamilus streckersoni TaxID=2493646 RepID=A0AAE0W9P2_9BIVA|nr:hypothetical protein CHS0354_024563 [Potamilus streckersoni]
MFLPVFETPNIPLSVVGKGNCFYRAVSLAISGSEHLDKLLRLMTAIEMILNKTTYNENADLNKSSNNPLNSSADAGSTEKREKNNYPQDDDVKLTEEDGNDDNPAKGGLEVGKFKDASKVVHLLLSSESSLGKQNLTW